MNEDNIDGSDQDPNYSCSGEESESDEEGLDKEEEEEEELEHECQDLYTWIKGSEHCNNP